MIKAPRFQLTLFGPEGLESSAWRKVIVEFSVGSEECPDWQSAEICRNAIEDLVKLSNGVLSDAVLASLKSHVRVVGYEEFGS